MKKSNNLKICFGGVERWLSEEVYQASERGKYDPVRTEHGPELGKRGPLIREKQALVHEEE